MSKSMKNDNSARLDLSNHLTKPLNPQLLTSALLLNLFIAFGGGKLMDNFGVLSSLPIALAIAATLAVFVDVYLKTVETFTQQIASSEPQ